MFLIKNTKVWCNKKVEYLYQQKMDSLYCTTSEFVSEPYPYRTAINFLNQNSLKLLNRYSKLKKILTQQSPLYQKIYSS